MINKYVVNSVSKNYKLIEKINCSTQFIKNGESIMTININNIKNKLDEWKQHMGNITPYFAVKSLPDPIVCNQFSHFDCASTGELQMIQKLNKKNNIIFANTCKRPSDIEYAFNNNINFFTLDSEEELNKIQSKNDNFDFLVRLSVDDSHAQVKFSNKFGISTIDEFKNIVDKINDKNNLLGFSFHVGSGQTDINAYINAINKMEYYIDYLKSYNKKLYNKLNTIDIGGGFNKKTDLGLINKSIQSKLNKYNDFNWIAEPGRYFAESCATLICPIILKKKKNNKTIIVIPNSIYHSFSNKFYDNFQMSCLKKDNSNEEHEMGMIVGDTCDGIDIIYEGYIPTGLNIGDIIIFDNMGAYTFSSSSNFNGFAPPKHFYLS